MVVGAFPLAKLAYLSIRQVSKPLAAGLKNGAKRSHVFRKYVCLPTAQIYHWTETAFKMYLLGLGKPKSVAPLNEQMAVELGADILGEMIIFGVAAILTVSEYNRTSAKAKLKEDELYDRLVNIEQKLQETAIVCERQKAQILELQRQAYMSPLAKIKEKLAPAPCEIIKSKGIIADALTESIKSFTGYSLESEARAE